MKTITIDEIQNLYKKCGLEIIGNQLIRTEINTGTLNNKLNADYSFLYQNSTQTTWASSANALGNK